MSQVNKRDNNALGIERTLLSVWILQSLNKVGRSNQTLLRLCQETQENWIRLLPIALLNMWLAPRHKLKLNAFELLYGRPIIPQAQRIPHTPWNGTTQVCPPDRRNYETSYGVCNQYCHSFWPGDGTNLKTWKASSWHDQPTPKWNEAHLVTLTTHSALELPGITPWAHHTQVRRDHKP